MQSPGDLHALYILKSMGFKDAVISVLFNSIDIHEHPLCVLKSMSNQDVKVANIWGYNNHRG